MRRWLHCPIIVLLLTTTSAIAQQPKTIMLAMSDGVKLATDVYVPRKGGPFPVVLSRTPYGKRRGSAALYNRAGVAVVRQDMRGRFGSAGENLPFVGCGWAGPTDGAETVAWILKQPWCNGKIGTEGASAGGITQNLLAGANPEGLACQYIIVAAGSLYHQAAYPGGALRHSQITQWLSENRFSPKAVQLYREHPAYDDYWKRYDAIARAGEINAPAVHVGGWFDTFSQGTIDAFVSRQTLGGPKANGKQKLVMGPWGHGIGASKIGELEFPLGRLPVSYSHISMFRHYLLGMPNGFDELKPVAYYVMGDTSGDIRTNPGNEWRFADAWPIPAKETPLYLSADRTLSTGTPAAVKVRGKAVDFVEYTFNPQVPCPTVGGCNLVLPKGPMDQRKVERRQDVIAFTTPPLKAPLEVTGNVVAKIRVTPSTKDTDLSVRFCDVYANGASYLMAEGMLRLRYRNSLARPEPLTPDEPTDVTVKLWATSIVINRGHRIRVTITSSNYPRFDVNPGTGDPPKPNVKPLAQTNRIHCDGASRILLPVAGG